MITWLWKIVRAVTNLNIVWMWIKCNDVMHKQLYRKQEIVAWYLIASIITLQEVVAWYLVASITTLQTTCGGWPGFTDACYRSQMRCRFYWPILLDTLSPVSLIWNPLLHRPDADVAPALMCDDCPLGELPQRHAIWFNCRNCWNRKGVLQGW